MNTKVDALGTEQVFRMIPATGLLLGEFYSKTEEILEIRFPEEYLERAQVMVLMDQYDLICGGAMIVDQPEFRSLQGIPNYKNRDWFHQEFGNGLAEVNGVWVDPKIKSPILPLTFWRKLIGYLLNTGFDRFLFTFDNANFKMKKVTSWLQHDVLYSGRTLQLDGMPKPSDETIALITRASFASLHETLSRNFGSAVPRYENVDESEVHQVGEFRPAKSELVSASVVKK